MRSGFSRRWATSLTGVRAWSAHWRWPCPAQPDPGIEVFTGVVEGSVATGTRGTGGFGYDPIFELPSGLTTAELAESEKDLLSHRGRAIAAAMPRLLEVLVQAARSVE